jgi:predicted metal-dependent TIM-barrel fold hydrolase
MNGYVVWVPETDFHLFKKKAKYAENFDVLSKAIESERNRARETKLNTLVAAVAKPLGIDDEQKQMIKNILSQHPLVKQMLG